MHVQIVQAWLQNIRAYSNDMGERKASLGSWMQNALFYDDLESGLLADGADHPAGNIEAAEPQGFTDAGQHDVYRKHLPDLACRQSPRLKEQCTLCSPSAERRAKAIFSYCFANRARPSCLEELTFMFISRTGGRDKDGRDALEAILMTVEWSPSARSMSPTCSEGDMSPTDDAPSPCRITSPPPLPMATTLPPPPPMAAQDATGRHAVGARRPGGPGPQLETDLRSSCDFPTRPLKRWKAIGRFSPSETEQEDPALQLDETRFREELARRLENEVDVMEDDSCISASTESAMESAMISPRTQLSAKPTPRSVMPQPAYLSSPALFAQALCGILITLLMKLARSMHYVRPGSGSRAAASLADGPPELHV